jgi:hypothetical protein
MIDHFVSDLGTKVFSSRLLSEVSIDPVSRLILARPSSMKFMYRFSLFVKISMSRPKTSLIAPFGTLGLFDVPETKLILTVMGLQVRDKYGLKSLRIFRASVLLWH